MADNIGRLSPARIVESYKKQNWRHGKSHHLLVKNAIGRLPLQENEIVAPSEMFVIGESSEGGSCSLKIKHSECLIE